MSQNFTLIRASYSDGIAIVTCIPQGLCDVNQIRLWNDEISDVIDSLNEGDRLVLDFGPVLILSSFALQKLIRINNYTKTHNIGFGLCNMDAQVKKIFEITYLTDCFIMGDTVEDTLNKLGTRPLDRQD